MMVVIDIEEVMLVYDLISEYGEEDVNLEFLFVWILEFLIKNKNNVKEDRGKMLKDDRKLIGLKFFNSSLNSLMLFKESKFNVWNE